jgi:hypothetical protein
MQNRRSLFERVPQSAVPNGHLAQNDGMSKQAANERKPSVALAPNSETGRKDRSAGMWIDTESLTKHRRRVPRLVLHTDRDSASNASVRLEDTGCAKEQTKLQQSGSSNMSGAQTHSEPILLQSWKEIAAYLGRGVRTVQRYERKLGLPVRRLGKSSGSIAAVKAEVDAWFRETSRIGVCSPENESIVCPFCFGTGQLGGRSDLHMNGQEGGTDPHINENVGIRGPAETEMAA